MLHAIKILLRRKYQAQMVLAITPNERWTIAHRHHRAVKRAEREDARRCIS